MSEENKDIYIKIAMVIYAHSADTADLLYEHLSGPKIKDNDEMFYINDIFAQILDCQNENPLDVSFLPNITQEKENYQDYFIEIGNKLKSVKIDSFTEYKIDTKYDRFIKANLYANSEITEKTILDNYELYAIVEYNNYYIKICDQWYKSDTNETISFNIDKSKKFQYGKYYYRKKRSKIILYDFESRKYLLRAIMDNPDFDPKTIEKDNYKMKYLVKQNKGTDIYTFKDDWDRDDENNVTIIRYPNNSNPSFSDYCKAKLIKHQKIIEDNAGYRNDFEIYQDRMKLIATNNVFFLHEPSESILVEKSVNNSLSHNFSYNILIYPDPRSDNNNDNKNNNNNNNNYLETYIIQNTKGNSEYKYKIVLVKSISPIIPTKFTFFQDSNELKESFKNMFNLGCDPEILWKRGNLIEKSKTLSNSRINYIMVPKDHCPNIQIMEPNQLKDFIKESKK